MALVKSKSAKRLLQAKIADGGEAPEGDWVCFCCTKRNAVGTEKCCVCGRSDAYICKREILPLHGAGGQYFRKSQIKSLFRDEGDIVETDDRQVSDVATFMSNVVCNVLYVCMHVCMYVCM
jgi:hypothetical protein